MKLVPGSSMALIMTLGLAGCGSPGGAPLSARSSRPTPAFAREMQNSAGCLDLERIFRRIALSKASRDQVVDVEVEGQPGRGDAPVSGLFAHAFIYETRLTERPIQTEGAFEQEGCSYLFSYDNGKPVTIQLVSATPTRLVTEELAPPEPPTAGDCSPFIHRYTYELTGEQELHVTFEVTYQATHDCGARHRPVVESRRVAFRSVAVWGEELPRPPASSQSLIDLKRRAMALDRRDSHERSLEREYCRRATERRPPASAEPAALVTELGDEAPEGGVSLLAPGPQ